MGPGPAFGTVAVTVFVPAVDRDGNSIDQAAWREAALTVLGRLFRGATAFPPSRGVWRDDERGGRLVFEETCMVVSYVAEADLTDDAIAELVRFLKRLGREGRQGEVGVVIGSTYHGITDFTESAP